MGLKQRFISMALAGVLSFTALVPVANVVYAEDKSGYPAAAPSKAPDLTRYQWERSGRTYTMDGVEIDPGIHIPNWNQPGGNMDGEVIVAVIDTGIDWRHSEFKDKIVTFTKEQQRELGCTEHGFAVDGSLEDPDYLDAMNTHGTHLAGIIGAAWDGAGISGIGDKVKFLDVACGSTGTITADSILEAMDFIMRAKEKAGINVRVANHSYLLHTSSPAIDRAIRKMGQMGIVSCVASGNDNLDLDAYVNSLVYLRSNPYAIIVEGSNVLGEKYHEANYSTEGVHIAAPGESILSTVGKEAFMGAMYMPGYVAEGEDRVFFDGAEGKDGVTFQFNKAEAVDDKAIDIGDEIDIVQKKTTDMAYEGDHSYIIQPREDKDIDTPGYAITIDGIKADKPATDKNAVVTAFLAYVSGEKEDSIMSQFFVKKTDGTWENIGGNGYGTWAALTADLPEDTDWDSFGLRIFVNSDGFAKGAKLYIDSLCIGTREKDMYAYTSGTSMAAPQAAGAAALMTAAHPDESPEQIRARVIGSVTPVDAFKDLSATGGLLDLSVKEEDYGPTVTAATADTQSAVLTGYYFGNDAGSISAVVTKNGITKNCDVGITSWTDREVHLTFKEKAEGVVSFTLTKANNKSFRIRTEVAGSDRKWKELALPAGIDNYESDGLLSALGDKIYYLPYRTGNNIKYVDKMYIYDISANKWSKGPKVPNMLGNASAAVYKGKVYVRGNQLDSYDGLLLESGIYPVYSYNPAKGKWMKNADAEGLNTSVLATYNDNLVLVGTEAVKEGDVLQYLSGSEIRKYNPKKGTGKKIAGLKTTVTSGCKTAALNGKLYIFSYVEYDDRVGDKKPLYSFKELAGNKVKDLSMALPIRYEGTSINGLQDVSRAELVHGNKGIDGYSLLSVNDKIVLFGRDDVYKSRNSWAYTPGEEFFSELEE